MGGRAHAAEGGGGGRRTGGDVEGHVGAPWVTQPEDRRPRPPRQVARKERSCRHLVVTASVSASRTRRPPFSDEAKVLPEFPAARHVEASRGERRRGGVRGEEGKGSDVKLNNVEGAALALWGGGGWGSGGERVRWRRGCPPTTTAHAPQCANTNTHSYMH